MKKLQTITITFFAVILFSCVPVEYTVKTVSIDLKRFSDEGFIMSTASPLEHTPVSVLYIDCSDGYLPKKQDSSKKKKPDDIYYSSDLSGNWKKCDLNELLNELYLQAKQQGANGIFNLNYQYYPKMEVSGLAVKVK